MRFDGMTIDEIKNFNGNSYAVCSSLLWWKRDGMTRQAAQERLIDLQHVYGPFSGTIKDLELVYNGN